MRLMIIAAAAAALSLGACKNNDQHDNTMNVDENLTAENIVSNDVTAIDAVTGDAANMAADVNYTEELNETADNSASNGAAPKATAKPQRKAPAPGSDAPSGNAASNATE